MSRPIEDYGFIGNMQTAALVGIDGSIDWLCLPRFDSDACFAALLGTPGDGHWSIAPDETVRETTRSYLPGTAVLQTVFRTDHGRVALLDFMPVAAGEGRPAVIRIVRGLEGRVAMKMSLVLRFGYGRTTPWVRRRDYGLHAVAGPDAVELATPVELHGEDMTTTARFVVERGRSVPFTLAYHPSHLAPGFIGDRQVELERTAAWWRDWIGGCLGDTEADERWHDAVVRSLITLKAMTYAPTGGVVAAATTSLPESVGGTRNWDYRYCWIRDATLTIYTFCNAGFFDEAQAFRRWLLRAAAGSPSDMQIMYGLAGEHRLTETELDWLPGYEGSRPVRIGNEAHSQLQLDVYGELMDALHAARRSRLGHYHAAWQFQRVLLDHLAEIWREPDQGLWEVRGPPRRFTYSRLMSWVAFDRAIKAVEQFDVDGPVARWRAIRDEIRADILAHGYDARRNTFVQHYETSALDASLLLLAAVGFLEPDDPRFRGTVEAVEQDLLEDGFVKRYRTHETDDGLAGGEGTFLICSFWLADAWLALGRRDDAVELFERLLAVRNDVGLLAEQYDPRSRRQLGNVPQAFSHLGLVNTAFNLLRSHGPSEQRADRSEPPHSTEIAPADHESNGIDHD